MCVTTVDETASLNLFAVTAPGLEQVCAAELRTLGSTAVATEGGVAWEGDLRTLYRANLESRTVSRIVARVGAFRARTFAELERHTARLPWDRYVAGGAVVALRVTCRKSKLYHEGAVAQRIANVLADLAGIRATARRAGLEDDDDGRVQLVVVRCFRDQFTISVDSSGALLHQRGFRQAVAQAPLRETLAAAMLLAAGWRGTTPLLDPLCGSGTIPIEAGLLARRIPPGLANEALIPRRYAFENWPGFDAAIMQDVVTCARAAVRSHAGVAIVGSDRHGGAIAAARANAERAGVATTVTFVRRALTVAEAPPGPGHLVTNPPYGVRVGDRRELASLYAALGRLAVERLPGWTVAMLSADPLLDAATRLPLRELLSTRNGGIAVRLLTAEPAHGAHSADGPG